MRTVKQNQMIELVFHKETSVQGYAALVEMREIAGHRTKKWEVRLDWDNGRDNQTSRFLTKEFSDGAAANSFYESCRNNPEAAADALFAHQNVIL